MENFFHKISKNIFCPKEKNENTANMGFLLQADILK